MRYCALELRSTAPIGLPKLDLFEADTGMSGILATNGLPCVCKLGQSGTVKICPG